MKRLSVFILAVLAGLCLFSCEKVGTEKQKTDFDFSVMGKMHNDGLEVIFSGIQEVGVAFDINQTKENQQNSYIETIKNNAILYVEQETDHNAEAVSLAKDLLSKFLDDVPEYAEHKPTDNTIYTPYIQSSKMSAAFNTQLKNLNEIATDKDLNLQSLLSRLQQLETTVRNSSLIEKEKNILLAGISVAQESYQYWYGKGDEWLETLNVPGQKRKISWKRVGNADISGAVDGAISTFAAALVGGPAGWGAMIVGVAAGAAGSSASEAVGQLLE